MRNPTALAFNPHSGELYALVQERDGLGDYLPSDYFTRVQDGGFYGWPYAYIGKHPQAGFASLAPDKVNATIAPDLLFEAHSSAMDLVFYEGEQFPAEYKGAHSSRSRVLGIAWSPPATRWYVCRSRTASRKTITRTSSPASGFRARGALRCGDARPRSPSRSDGSLLIADDTGGTIWRIAYTDPPDAMQKTNARKTNISDASLRHCSRRDCSLRDCVT